MKDICAVKLAKSCSIMYQTTTKTHIFWKKWSLQKLTTEIFLILLVSKHLIIENKQINFEKIYRAVFEKITCENSNLISENSTWLAKILTENKMNNIFQISMSEYICHSKMELQLNKFKEIHIREHRGILRQTPTLR